MKIEQRTLINFINLFHSFTRYISLSILYLIATVFPPMPICGCCMVSTNKSAWKDEIDGFLNGHSIASFEFLGWVGLAGVLLFLPATILLHCGQKKDRIGAGCLRLSGFILMVVWACVSLYQANINFEEVIHFKTKIDAHNATGSSSQVSPAIYAYKLLALDIALAIPCACILVRKQKCISHQSY